MRHKIVIIGSGFGGIGMGIGLRKAGFDDFVILEKATELGGTWRGQPVPGLRLRRAVAASTRSHTS